MCGYLYIAALRRIAMGTDHFSATIAAKRGGLSAERRSAENLSVAASPLMSDVACFEYHLYGATYYIIPAGGGGNVGYATEGWWIIFR